MHLMTSKTMLGWCCRNIIWRGNYPQLTVKSRQIRFASKSTHCSGFNRFWRQIRNSFKIYHILIIVFLSLMLSFHKSSSLSFISGSPSLGCSLRHKYDFNPRKEHFPTFNSFCCIRSIDIFVPCKSAQFLIWYLALHPNWTWWIDSSFDWQLHVWIEISKDWQLQAWIDSLDWQLRLTAASLGCIPFLSLRIFWKYVLYWSRWLIILPVSRICTCSFISDAALQAELDGLTTASLAWEILILSVDKDMTLSQTLLFFYYNWLSKYDVDKRCWLNPVESESVFYLVSSPFLLFWMREIGGCNLLLRASDSLFQWIGHLPSDLFVT